MTTSEPTTLRECPFCGGEATVSIGEKARIKMPYVECIECASTSDLYPTEKEAIEAWNRRFDEQYK